MTEDGIFPLNYAMARHISKRFQNLGASSFDLFVKAKELEKRGITVIHMELGEPDLPTPDPIKEKAYEGLEKDYTHYTNPQGLEELREAISRYEAKRYGKKIPPDRIVVTPGAKPMILYSLMAVTNPEDEVLYPVPGYLTYPTLISLAGAKPVPYRLDPQNDYQPDLDELKEKVSSRTAAIILNSPSNPTGSILSLESIKEIMDLATGYDFYIVSDEIYSRLVFEGEFASAMMFWESDGRVLLIDGMSKAFSMTGWRLGYGIVPEHLVRPIVKLVTNTVSCAPAFVQYAGVEALNTEKDHANEIYEVFKKRRELLINLLMGTDLLEVYPPKGTFYVFPKYRVNAPSRYVAEKILEIGHVSVLPGILFGEPGENHLRISFSVSEKEIEEGINRILKVLKELSS